jgi:hypothetical protein
VEIIDHHADMGLYPWVNGEARLIAYNEGQALVGSTCTLIAQKVRAAQVEAFRIITLSQFLTESPDSLSADVAILLIGALLDQCCEIEPVCVSLGVILLDTVNMDESVGKGTPLDAELLDALQTRLHDFVPGFNRE